MKVLYYNWVDIFDDKHRGGGVSIYQRNLAAAFDEDPNTEVVFLSSGLSYDLLSRRPRWEELRTVSVNSGIRRFEIVNSAVLAPAHHSFGNPTQLAHSETMKTFQSFVEKTGPYDVIHFNNLEGVPAEVLSLKSRLPKTKFVLSLHNYYPFCPQVNLWHKEQESCLSFNSGKKCGDCLLHRPDERLIRLANSIGYRLNRLGMRHGTRGFDVLFFSGLRVVGRFVRTFSKLRHQNITQTATEFAQRRSRITALINQNCDVVLCVSKRVQDIAHGFGVAHRLTKQNYIGTHDAALFDHTAASATLVTSDGTLTLGYIGYMRRDKGFYFLLSALESLPSDLAARITLVVAAKTGPPEVMARLNNLRSILAGVHHFDGYCSDDLDAILKPVDVGVVPVLWEDNLPQVALEMHARHIPLLTSDLGGAKELSSHPDMTFKANDIKDFHQHLSKILENQINLPSYWKTALTPISVAQHISVLRQVYTAL